MDTSFSNAELNLDRAYISVNPEMAGWLTLTGGRIANPFVHTNMVWDSDLNFDGAAEKVSFAVSEDVSLFATLGQFSLGTDSDGEDSPLWAFQVGASADISDVLGTELAVAYYNFQDPGEGELTAGNNTPGVGEILLYDYRILDVVNKCSLEVMEMPLSLWWNVAINLADEPSGADNMDDTAWGLGRSSASVRARAPGS